MLVAVALAAPAAAHASTAEVFGLGSVESALGGASAARVHDFSAAYYNPAGLTGLAGPHVTLGVLGYGARLRINGQQAPALSDPVGAVIGAATPIPLRGALSRRLYIGIALVVVPDIVRVIAHAPEDAFFPYLENRTQRLLVLPALAARLGHGVSLGIAGNFLARLDGRIAATEGATHAVEARVDEQTISTVRLHAGVRWQSPRERLALAIVYRQAFSVPFVTRATTRVAGQPLDLDVIAESLYTPHTLVLGSALRLSSRLLLSADLRIGFWSAWRGPWVNVRATLPLAGDLPDTTPRLGFRDTFSPRIGLEYVRPIGRSLVLALRGGGGFENSPIPAQQSGITNLLDGHKGLLSAGLGLTWRVHGLRVGLDAHGQVLIIGGRTLTKRVAAPGEAVDPTVALRDEVPDDPNRPETLGLQISNPGWPSITSSGLGWACGLTFSVER